jgi:hypothetical protein
MFYREVLRRRSYMQTIILMTKKFWNLQLGGEELSRSVKGEGGRSAEKCSFSIQFSL